MFKGRRTKNGALIVSSQAIKMSLRISIIEKYDWTEPFLVMGTVFLLEKCALRLPLRAVKFRKREGRLLSPKTVVIKSKDLNFCSTDPGVFVKIFNRLVFRRD